MATKGDPSVVGRRVLLERNRRRLTAEHLADRIPDPALTKTVITNLESGRKKDATATELFQLASALDIEPMQLMLDFYAPFDLVEIPGLAAPYAGMCVAEYLVALDHGSIKDVTPLGRAKTLFRRLRLLERSTFHHRAIEDLLETTGGQFDDFDASIRVSDGTWEAWVRQRDFGEEEWATRLRGIQNIAAELTDLMDRGGSDLISDVGWLRARVDRALRLAKETEHHGAPADPAE